VAQKDQVWVLATVVVGCAIDALVAAAAFRGRVGLGGLLWLGLRALLSVFGFLFLTLPFYAIALILLSQAPSPDGRSDPSLPHAYRPVSAGWLWRSRVHPTHQGAGSTTDAFLRGRARRRLQGIWRCRKG